MEDKKCKLKIIKNQLSIDNSAQRGFTIVELMMTMFMSSIILISIYVIVSKSHEYINDAKPKIQLQQDFSLIETLLSSKIRQSLNGPHEIYNNYSDYVASQPKQSSGTCMKLYFPSGDSTILYKDNSDFKIMNTDSTFTNLVPGVLDSLIFTEKTYSVQTKVSLSQGTWSLEETFVAAFRNFGNLGNRRCELVIQSSQVPASLTDFPLLLTAATLPSEMFDADGANPALDGGGDIKFSRGKTRLSCEIVTFTTDNNPALGKAEIWVKVPSVSAGSNTSIWVWYDKSGESQPDSNAAFGSESVWDDNYGGVWHLNEATGSTNIDVTSNTNDGTPQNSPASIAGKIDGALNFEVATQTRVEVGTAGSLDLSLYANWTISAWVKPSTNYVNSKYPTIYSYGDYRAALDIAVLEGPQDGLIEHYRNDTNGVYSNTVMNINAWNHVVVVFDPDTTRFYLNGGYDGFGLSVTINQDNGGAYIGGWPGYTDGDLLGVIDEVRVSNAGRSADWMAAEYNNQNDPATFVIEGTPVTP